ncbi:MAG: LuxR C-terminal-related transcriptional regulator [Candidatus Eremiobacteraeota bacterium]|nr:LuxR C-terminal-related transcriptional regulator [Candidatus Eremiobacteraeota bacterium]
MQNTRPKQNPAAFIASGGLSDTAAMSEANAAPATSSAPAIVLTKREQEVLELMAFGLSNKEIARRLSLGRRTVETHIDHVLSKLNAPTRTRAVVEAGRAGLLGSAVSGASGSPIDLHPNNLPIQLTTLLGREQDLIDAEHLLKSNRLLTLSGSGGVGKTRLGLGIGVDLLDQFPNGVWFCDFSPISESSLLPSVVAKVLAVREQQSRSPLESIVDALKRKRALLILDNCEHVLDTAAELCDEILHQCPHVRILATSRQALGIVGEVVHRVRSLALPETTSGLKADRAMRYGAIALFMDRAQASDTHFTLTNDNAPIVAEICHRLDGIPLAIELAATRINAVNIESLAQSLDDRFRVLTAGSRTALPRHKTLAALIDWSYDLLSPTEQQLFNRLGVFAGSFSLQAAAAVCAGGGLDDRNISDLVIALVGKSLVVVQTGGNQERYRLLESTRAYALEKLNASGEQEQCARRHSEYFRDQARAADERYGVGSTAGWLASLELDLENYRATLEWALAERHDVALGASVAGTLERLWALGGLSIEARLWLGAAIERVNESDHPAIAARLWRAKSRFLQGEPMRDCAERAVALYQSVGDGRGAGYALRTLAYSLLQMGRLDEANDVIVQAIAALREYGDRVGVASCLSLQGVSAYNRGDFAKGREFYTQALAAYKALGDELATANVLGNLGELEFADGHPDEALKSVSESLEITSRGKEATDLAIDYNNSAAYRIALGNLEEARTAAREGLRWAQPEQNPWNTAVALQHLALLAALREHVHAAAQLLGYVNAQFKELELERETTEKWGYEKLMSALRQRLSDTEIAHLSDEGGVWSEDRAVKEALKV